MNWEIIGYIGAACTTLCFIPQIFKTMKTKCLDDVSYGYFAVLGFGVFMWLMYGIGIKNLVIVSANAVTLLFVLSLLFMKMYYKKK